MTNAVIHLAPTFVMSEMYFSKDPVTLAKNNLRAYSTVPTIPTEFSGQDAAEEMFDLTNNPGRQDEREEKYGRGRSLSVGDIVEVGTELYLCVSCGWEKL